ncbi:MAG TPA: methyltransferase domain-containing protein [Candidatus Brocadiaceae bacterium]|nr:methyltransferase domain-containing protein [Candidatus Brocadiaceae bacterium]
MPVKSLSKGIRGLRCKGASKGVIAQIVDFILSRRTKKRLAFTRPFITGNVLDLGCSIGSVSCSLLREGLNVRSVDVEDVSIYEDIKVDVYDGTTLKYRDKEFKSCLLTHVLHHCSDQIAVLKEAQRVSKRVIIIEDVYRNGFERFLVYFNDILGNFGDAGGNYRSEKEWEVVFEYLGLKVLKKKVFLGFPFPPLYCRYSAYVLE